MHAWPELRKLMVPASRRHLARTELLQRLRHLQDMSGMQVVVVFDGTQAVLNEEREKDGLQIIYADSGTTADNVIERLVAKYGSQRPMRVVSADGMVRETISAFGAEWHDPDHLRRLCDDAERDMRRHLGKRD